MSANQAAWLTAKAAYPFQVDEAPMPRPKVREVVIRHRAVAINPCDAGVQKFGILWQDFPIIIGCDVAGEVIEVGSGVVDFEPGDRVMALVEHGAFALYSAADTALVAKVPDNVSYTEACVLPLGLTTAAIGIFHPDNMGLELPSLSPTSSGKTVLVWGGSSSVGSCAVQLVKAAGYDVATTASAHNAEYCKGLGASHVFDHRTEDVEGRIVESLQGREFAGVFSAIMTPDVMATCARIAGQLGTDEKSKVVGSALPPSMPYTDPLPEGVRVAYSASTCDVLPDSELSEVLGHPMSKNNVAPHVWGEWVALALEQGIMKCKPAPEVVGRGLSSIQDAVDRMGKGVSATKLVVEM